MDKDLRELVEGAEGRAEKATPGDWNTDAPYNRRAILVFACDEPGQPVIAEMKEGPNWNNDSEFIAHARQDVPALCAAVRRLDTALQERTEAASAWDALAVARLKIINTMTEEREKMRAAWSEFVAANAEIEKTKWHYGRAYNDAAYALALRRNNQAIAGLIDCGLAKNEDFEPLRRF